MRARRRNPGPAAQFLVAVATAVVSSLVTLLIVGAYERSRKAADALPGGVIPQPIAPGQGSA